MAYLVLFILCVFGWLMDVVLQAAYYWGTGPFGMPNVSADVGICFCKSIYYSACFFAVFGIPGMLGLAVARRVRPGDDAAVPRGIYILHVLLLTFLITLNHVDHEVFRFMGMHYSVEMLRAYNIFSNTTSFVGDALRTDARGAYSSLFLLAVPLAFLVLSLVLRRRILAVAQRVKISARLARAIAWSGTGLLIVLMLTSFVKVDDMRGFGWYPSRIQQKLAPYFVAFFEDLRYAQEKRANAFDYSHIAEDIARYQAMWTAEETDPNWRFVSSELPFRRTYAGQCPKALGNGQPNIVILFVETMRAMNLPDFNRDVQDDPMPFLHSLIAQQNEILQRNHLHTAYFDRYLAAALPTIDAMMSTHIGLPAHSEYTVSSVFFADNFPSFVTSLRRHGYDTTFIDSADAGFTNWSNWVRRWYEHFTDLNTRDDKLTVQALGDQIVQSRQSGKPYIVTTITTTNHIPFNVPKGGVQPPEGADATERIKFTLRYTDDQIRALFERLDRENALSNTLFLILGDHGYSLDEVPNESGIGGNYDTLRYNVVWVPLVMVTDLEGIPQGRQTVPASHVDLGPTILATTGICDDNSFAGHSLLTPAAHHILVNKKGNYLYRDETHTTIGVLGWRGQLYRTDDRLETTDLWQSDAATMDALRDGADTYRRVLDYAYEKHVIIPPQRL